MPVPRKPTIAGRFKKMTGFHESLLLCCVAGTFVVCGCKRAASVEVLSSTGGELLKIQKLSQIHELAKQGQTVPVCVEVVDYERLPQNPSDPTPQLFFGSADGLDSQLMSIYGAVDYTRINQNQAVFSEREIAALTAQWLENWLSALNAVPEWQGLIPRFHQVGSRGCFRNEFYTIRVGLYATVAEWVKAHGSLHLPFVDSESGKVHMTPEFSQMGILRPDETRRILGHELGHVLGLGDTYEREGYLEGLSYLSEESMMKGTSDVLAEDDRAGLRLVWRFIMTGTLSCGRGYSELPRNLFRSIGAGVEFACSPTDRFRMAVEPLESPEEGLGGYRRAASTTGCRPGFRPVREYCFADYYFDSPNSVMPTFRNKIEFDWEHGVFCAKGLRYHASADGCRRAD